MVHDSPDCRAQENHDTSRRLDQGGSSSRRPSNFSAAVLTSKPDGTSKLSTALLNRLGPQPKSQGKAPVKERLGRMTYTRHHAGGRVPPRPEPSKTPIASRSSTPQGVRESAKGRELKRAGRKVTRDDGKLVIHAEATPKVSNDRHPQKKTCLSKRDNVTLGGGSAADEESHQRCTSHHDKKHHHSERGNTRKRTIDDIDCSCSCAQLIKTLLSGCACSESKSHQQRASVFERLSLPTTEELKPKPRHFRKRRPAQRDEFPEVTINVVSKGKGEATADTDPDFTPEGKVSAPISRRMARLQRRAARRRDYRRMHEGESSENEASDSCSAIASDDTMSSIGHPREAYTITPESMAQMLQEALAKQREDLRAEMKTEIELAMQQMMELQSQKAAQPESSQQGVLIQRIPHDVEESDPEVDETIIVNPPPKKTIPDAQTGDGTKQDESESGKMKELEGKLNALISAQEVKKTGIPCPYPREWDSIPYPPKFNLINFTPFDGRGSPTQHLIYFKSHLGVISGNEPLMVRSFVGTLRAAAFDWYRRLKAGSINSWDDMESSFLNNFFDDDTEVSIGTLLDEKQKNGETIDVFVKRFRNKAMNCRDPVTEEFILQTCHNNLSLDLLEAMGVVAPATWKELKLRGEQAERFLKRKKAERDQPIAAPPKPNFVPRGRGKAPATAVDANQTFQQQRQQPQQQQQQQPQLRFQQRPQEAQKTPDPKFQKSYTFKEEEVPVIFKYLLEHNKIKLPPITNQEEANKTSDPKYCAYHRRVHHPTMSCFVLKDKIQALIDAGVITAKKEKKVGSNMVAINFGSMPPMLYQQKIVPEVEVKTINDDLHGQRQKGLVPHTAPNGEVLWVHPDLLQDEQWTGSSSKQKSKRKGKSCNHISAISEGDDEKIPILSSSENEQEVFTTEGELALATRSGHEYGYKYPEISDPNAKTLTELGVPIIPAHTENPQQQAIDAEDRAKLKEREDTAKLKEKQPYQAQIPKQSRFNRPIRKDKPESSNAQYRFDVMAQLANIPARITLYELLRLSKETRAALQEALADSEAFITRVEQIPEQPEQCNLAAKNFPCISFTRDDMQVRNSKHDRPLYFTGNIGSIAVNRIQVDPGSAVSIMPLRLMYHLGIPASKLASTGTVIYGFNTSGSRPLGKIRVKCQLGDLKSEVTCYVIDAETSYNLLLGRPWIHGNLIVPSTLHQCLKYVDTDNVVKTVVADKQPFKGLENYFTDSLLYAAESDTEPSAHGSDSGNEADTEAGLDYDVNFEPFVIDLDETESSGGSCNWQLAEEHIINGDLEYVPCVNTVMQGLYDNYGMHVPLPSSNQMKKCLQSSTEATFVVSTKDAHQTIFGKKGMSSLQNLFWETDDNEAGDGDEGTCKNWFKYSPQARQYMKKWGYDFVHGVGLSFGRGIRAPVRPSHVPKGKPDRYYESKRGLGYVTSSSDECCWQIDEHNSSSDSSAWDSDVSLGPIFKGLMANMTTISPVEPEKDDPLPDWEDPWTFHLTNQYGDRFEQREPPTKDEVIQINMGDEAHPKPIFISNSLAPEEKEELIALIREYIDVFAWSYEDMPGLDPNVATHRLNIRIDAKPIKQHQRRFRPQIMEAIVAEVKRLIKSGFIKEIQHPDWVSNIVPVLKKNGTIRVCVDYRDLNAACPKDDFPLPITDVIIDNTCGFERMSFMDGFSGYNQIKMHPDDEKHTAFRTPIGIFCYTVMPFGLKNAGATYQRAMTNIFQEHIQKTVECYVDDLVVKSRNKNDHIKDLGTVFDLMRKHQLKMNPTKSFLGMASGKFLGFVVTSKGIHIDPDKVKAINELQPPRNLKELRGLQGRLAYVRRFISNLAGKCQPFSKLAKKGVSFIWDDACQKAFEEIKAYLSNPPVLAAPKSGKPFLIYVRATNHSLSALLAQDDDNGHEQAVYYLSRTMVGAESRYPDIEKECLALVFAVQKMRHYLVGQTIHVISDVNPIRVFMTQPASLNWRLAKWALLLSQYDIHFKQQKSVKGQAICDLLALQPSKDKVRIYDDLPDETYEVNHTSQEDVWQLYFDGASRATNVASAPGCSKISSGVGIVLVSPGKHVMPRAYSLTEPCSNNVAEYNALLIGLSFAKELGVEYLEAFGDSQLIVNQVRGEYETRNPDLIPYYEAAVKMAESFESFFIEYIPRLQNTYADALAALAVSLAQPPETEQSITVRTHQLFVPEYALDIKEAHATNLESRDWRFPLIDYVLYGILPEDVKERESIRRRAPRFYYNTATQTLYRRTYDGLLLRCLSTKEAEEALKEAHDGTCGAHQPGPKLGDRLRRLGYYWPTMIKDAIAYAKRCHACQIHANYMHQPPEDLHPSATSWPFETWGMDVVGPIFPPSAKGDRFILAITDYFSKWAEAIPLKEVKTSDVVKFIKHHIIYRYGVPRRIVHDNGPQFVSNAFVRFCGKFRIQDVSSTAYNPTANGLAEAFNKTIIKILSKLVKTNKRDWDDKLGEALWAYRTTVRTPTGVTPYSLVYGCEAVLPLEIQIPSLRIALATGMTEDEQHQKRLKELEMLDEKCLEAQQQIELYQARISKAFNKKVRHRVFKEGDLVLAVRRPMILNSKKKGKFQPKWEGPFVIDTVYSNGAYRLITQNGDRMMMPINGKFLKKYYP